MSIQEIAALTLAGCAVLTDLRYGKIRNPLIIAGWIAGVLIFIIPAVIYFVHGLPADGVNELLMLMGGVAVPLILGAVLFRLRMLGAGDIKLLSAIGAIVGCPQILRVIVWSVVFGAAIAAAILIFCGGLASAAERIRRFARESLAAGRPVAYRDGSDKSGDFHFSIPVLMAVAVCAMR